MFFFQIKNFKIKNPKNCLIIFKKNNFLGFLVFTRYFNRKNILMISSVSIIKRLFFRLYTKTHIRKIISSNYFLQ